MQQVDRMIVVGLGVLVFSACSSLPAQVISVASIQAQTSAAVAPHPPPPRRAEIPPPAPSPQALWEFGHWSWNGQRYVWMPGHYVQRPSPTANWISDYWQRGPNGWRWVEGQWTS